MGLETEPTLALNAQRSASGKRLKTSFLLFPSRKKGVWLVGSPARVAALVKGVVARL